MVFRTHSIAAESDFLRRRLIGMKERCATLIAAAMRSPLEMLGIKEGLGMLRVKSLMALGLLFPFALTDSSELQAQTVLERFDPDCAATFNAIARYWGVCHSAGYHQCQAPKPLPQPAPYPPPLFRPMALCAGISGYTVSQPTPIAMSPMQLYDGDRHLPVYVPMAREAAPEIFPAHTTPTLPIYGPSLAPSNIVDEDEAAHKSTFTDRQKTEASRLEEVTPKVRSEEPSSANDLPNDPIEKNPYEKDDAYLPWGSGSQPVSRTVPHPSSPSISRRLHDQGNFKEPAMNGPALNGTPISGPHPRSAQRITEPNSTFPKLRR